MTSHDDELQPSDLIASWLDDLERAVSQRDAKSLADLFVEDAYWRDMIAFTWDLCWVAGDEVIAEAMLEDVDRVDPARWRIADAMSAPRSVVRGGSNVTEAFIEFDLSIGGGTGVVRLVRDERDGRLRCWTLLTRLRSLAGHVSEPWPAGVGYQPTPEAWSWQAHRELESSYADRDPEVLVVGGGHSGVFTAAYLKNLGVDALVVDRHPRVGDNWRTRYDALALHNPTLMVEFPFLPFPRVFPQFLPKDKLANWFESYVDAMEINYWTSTDFRNAEYDTSSQTWTVDVERDGVHRQLRPRHIVMATGGVGGAANIPQLNGIDSFRGEVFHTKDFHSALGYEGKNVLVVGTGSSGHDAAQYMTEMGAHVTMMQRSPTSVVSLESADMSYTQYMDGSPLYEADLLSSAGFVRPLMIPNFQALTRRTNEHDRDLLDNLRRAGMEIDDGWEGTGWFWKFFERAGGYYLDTGCSEMIISGQVKMLQARDVETFTPDGVRRHDGQELAFDTVILATGYENLQGEVRRFFGSELADNLGPIGGFDEDGELRNVWRPTKQPGLWFMTSGFAGGRNHGELVALQIRADLLNIARRPSRVTGTLTEAI